jgi:Zn-dependent peptidase ImmA (M78 family)
MPLTDTPRRYQEPRAHALRAQYLHTFGGNEIPVPVESTAEDLLGLRIEQSSELGDLSGTLLPAERLILLNASEAAHEGMPIRRQRYTIAHEIGHWVCHVLGADAVTAPQPSYCRAADLSEETDRALEREANVFAAELLMPEQAVRDLWLSAAQVDLVAAHFGVSQLAAHWRLHSFGLLDRPAPHWAQAEQGQA